MTQVYEKDKKDIRNSLRLVSVFQPMNIVVVAIHKEPLKNKNFKIPCSHALPLTGYAYNNVNDTYTIRCCGKLELGEIEVSYEVQIKGAAGWKFKMPLPVEVIRRYLNVEQRRLLRDFQMQFKDEKDDIAFEFVQMASAF